jgi:uncharacterized protein (DUF1697 family)
MPSHVAFLRAINVAGHGTVKMTDLRRVFERAGATDVRTVIQSGNVLFDAPTRDVPGIVRQVRRALGGSGASEPEILIRRVDDIHALVARDPFADHPPGPRIKCYVAFLTRTPKRTPQLPIVSAKELLEAIAIDGREVFILSRLKPTRFFGFPNNFIEDALGIAATTRNWSTVTAIAKLTRAEKRGRV